VLDIFIYIIGMYHSSISKGLSHRSKQEGDLEERKNNNTII